MTNGFSKSEIERWINDVHRVLFITGAGISLDSGLPTYRGVAGLYEDKETEDGIPIEVALSGGMFSERPQLTWKYLTQIANACEGKSFNRGHQIIAEIEDRIREVWVLTQNIDGFHKDAGSKNVIEIHGTMRRMRCTGCSYGCESSAIEDREKIPNCPQCGRMLRPAVVLFDEMLPETEMNSLQHQLNFGFDAIVVIGTSALFPYISNPVHIAASRNCLTVEINPEKTDLSNIVDIKLNVGATEGLEEILSFFPSGMARNSAV